ncbi:hypothetical protein L208DRAFT_1379362 [Tricholoma matsutake]|nr:hypothetical protein L208DRAFT_1379362 [Tricholoma matsutake 945]
MVFPSKSDPTLLVGVTGLPHATFDAQFKPKSLSGAGAEPRCDLLDLWRVAISEAHRDWEVAWMPMVHGTDKRMWVHFLDVSRNNGLWAKAANSPVCSSFMNKGGVILSLASPMHVNVILAMDRGLLEAWLTDNFVSEGESTLACTRVPSYESEVFVFHMMMWDATSKVLSPAAAKLFACDFSKYKSLVAPQSVYSVNNKGLWWWASVCEEFVKGSDSMKEGLKAMHRQINLMQKENCQNNEAVMDTQQALIQSARMGYSQNLSDLQTAGLIAKMEAMMMFDAAEQLKFEQMVAQPEQQEANLHAKIEEGTNSLQNLMGPHRSTTH